MSSHPTNIAAGGRNTVCVDLLLMLLRVMFSSTSQHGAPVGGRRQVRIIDHICPQSRWRAMPIHWREAMSIRARFDRECHPPFFLPLPVARSNGGPLRAIGAACGGFGQGVVTNGHDSVRRTRQGFRPPLLLVRRPKARRGLAGACGAANWRESDYP